MKVYVRGILFLLIIGATSACSNKVPSDASSESEKDSSAQISEQQVFLADPTIFYDSGVYYLYGTHVVKRGFEVYTSADLKNWEKAPDLALSKKEVYGDHGFWAPQVFRYKNAYYMAYTANEHIAIAKSDNPMGPFKQAEKKPFTALGKSIDPFIFIDDDGSKYLYFVKLQEGNRIFSAELKDDLSGIKPGTVTSCLNAVVHPQQWENMEDKEWSVTEGPTILKHEGTYFLFYSANDYRSIYYAVGYATAPSPMGPWTKYPGNPVLNKDSIGQNGPGHGDLFKDEKGQYYYVFHTHLSNNKVNPRKTALIKGDFISSGDKSDKMRFDNQSFYYLKFKKSKRKDD